MKNGNRKTAQTSSLPSSEEFNLMGGALTSNLTLLLALFSRQKSFSIEFVQQQHTSRQSVAHWLDIILISVPIIFFAI